MKNISIFKLFLLIFLFLALSCQQKLKYELATDSINPLLEPLQAQLNTEEKDNFNIHTKKGVFLVTPLYYYEIDAIILSKKRYRYDLGSIIAPLDLALGWGKFLANKRYHKYFKVSQSGRWYSFRVKDGAPFTIDYFYLHSANNHIIPATINLKKALFSLKKGDIIKLKGYLVKVEGNIKGKDFFWQSSTSRKDRGGGSCELFYVKSLQIGDRIYK